MKNFFSEIKVEKTTQKGVHLSVKINMTDMGEKNLIASFEENPDNWEPNFSRKEVEAFRRSLASALDKIQGDNPGKIICHDKFHFIDPSKVTKELACLAKNHMARIYDMQMYCAMFLENPRPTYPGGFGPRDIHPNAKAIQQRTVTIQDVRTISHPLGRGKMSQW